MVVRELYLYPDLVDYPNEITSQFRAQSRSICNYLERELRALKYKSQSFRRICFIGKEVPDNECYVNSSKVLIVEVAFNVEKYRSLEENELNEFFIDMLLEGFNKCYEAYDFPNSVMSYSIDSFRDNAYENRWIFKTKIYKKSGIKCSLECNLTLSKFYLKLLINEKDETLFEDCVLTAYPNEIIFVPMFKDLKFINDDLVILDKGDEIIYRINMTELCQLSK